MYLSPGAAMLEPEPEKEPLLSPRTQKILAVAAGAIVGAIVGRKFGKVAGAVGGAAVLGYIGGAIYDRVTGTDVSLMGLGEGELATCCERYKAGQGLYSYCNDSVLGPGWRNACSQVAGGGDGGAGAGSGGGAAPGQFIGPSGEPEWPYSGTPKEQLVQCVAAKPCGQKTRANIQYYRRCEGGCKKAIQQHIRDEKRRNR